MKYKDFFKYLFEYIPVAKNYWMDSHGRMNSTRTHQEWVYKKYPEGFKNGGYLNRPDLYEDLYDYAYKKGNVRIVIVPNQEAHSNGTMYYTYNPSYGISNLQKRNLKDYSIENGYELKNEDEI